MSDIKGQGFGEKHHWIKIETLQRNNPRDRMSLYVCKNCLIDFWHRYHVTSDIFQAMKEWGIPESCKKVNH